MLVTCLAIVALSTIREHSPTKGESYLIGRDRWAIGVSDDRGNDNRYAFITKDGKTVLERSAEKMQGSEMKAARAWCSAPWPIFVVSCHTGGSHGQTTEYYAVRGGRADLVLSIYGEVGGPIFRDFDGDGVLEWVFSAAYDNYLHLESQNFLVYRLGASRTYELWKTLPNPKHETLPVPRYAYY